MKFIANNVRNPVAMFLPLALIFGIISLILIPLGQNPDEPNHLYRAYQVSTGQIFSHRIASDELVKISDKGGEKWGGDVPYSYPKLFLANHVYETNHSSHTNTLYEKQEKTSLKSVWNIHTDSRKIATGFSNTAIYSPIVYVPTVLAIYTGNIFHLPTAMMLYVARLFNLLVGIGLCLAAIKLIPFGKWILFTIGLLPTTVTQLSAISADPVTIGFSFLTIAYILRIASQRPTSLQGKNIVSLSVILCGLALAKPVYALLAVFLLLIPLQALNTNRIKISLQCLIPTSICFVTAFIWQFAVRHVPPSFETVNKVHSQMAFVLSHPFQFIKTCFYTFFTDFGPSRFFYQSFYGSTVWNHILAPYPLVILLTIALVIAVRTEPIPFSTRIHSYRTLCLFIACVLIVAVAGGLYIAWAPLHATIITGMQGRYFIPFIPLLLLAFSPLKERTHNSLTLSAASIIVILTVSNALMLFITYKTLYTPGLLNTW